MALIFSGYLTIKYKAGNETNMLLLPNDYFSFLLLLLSMLFLQLIFLVIFIFFHIPLFSIFFFRKSLIISTPTFSIPPYLISKGFLRSTCHNTCQLNSVLHIIIIPLSKTVQSLKLCPLQFSLHLASRIQLIPSALGNWKSLKPGKISLYWAFFPFQH